MRESGWFRRRGRKVASGAALVSLAAAGLIAAAFAGGPLASIRAETTTTTTVPSTGKVTICHKTHAAKHPSVTIRISVRAWPAHRKHGDTLGACAPTTTTTTTATTTTTTTTTAAPTSAPGKSGTHRKNPHS
jgi:hypothetical protein